MAAEAARLAVMPLEREGGQAQFIVHPPPPAEGMAFAALLQWMEQRLHRPLTLDSIAKRAAMSVRSLSRHFRQQTGITPLQWLLRARIRQAQILLESTSYSVELVATHVGFGSAAAFRQQFRHATGTKPHSFRKAFQSIPLATARLV